MKAVYATLLLLQLQSCRLFNR